MNIRLSIAIPTLNRGELLEKTLEHLSKNLKECDEVVISDNCSEDLTHAICMKFSDILNINYVKTLKKLEMKDNFNSAVMNCRGKYLYILCDDDRLIMENLEVAVGILDREPDICAVFGGVADWDPVDGTLVEHQFVQARKDYERFRGVELINDFDYLLAPVCRRETIQRFGGFDSTSWAYWPCWIALNRTGRVSIVPKTFYWHARTPGRAEFGIQFSQYHGLNLAQFELAIGRAGEGERSNALLISQRMTDAYRHAIRFATSSGNYLIAHNFILRLRSYGDVNVEDINSFEKSFLLNCIIEKVIIKINQLLLPHIVITDDDKLFSEKIFCLLKEKVIGDKISRMCEVKVFELDEISDNILFICKDEDEYEKIKLIKHVNCNINTVCISDVFYQLNITLDELSDLWA